MRGQIKTGTTMLERVKYLKAILLDSDDIVTDISEVDNWEDFHCENQEEIDDMARIMKAETSLGVAMKKIAKAKQNLEEQRKNSQTRQTNMKFKKVEKEETEQLEEEQKTR